MAKTVFIFGLGYSGKVLARHLLAQGMHVRGTNRSGAGDSACAGAEIFTFSAGKPLADFAAAFDGVSHIISTIPAIDGRDPVLAAHGDDLAALRKSGGDPDLWAGYVSATSVYTESDGGVVTEQSDCNPASRRGQIRRAAEIAWLEKLDAEIFRTAGIYGPGRSVFDSLRNGTARIIRKPGQVFNRIHVEDMARVIAAAMENPRARRILNLADGHPAEAGEVVRYAAKLLGIAPPAPVAFEDAIAKGMLSPMARSFYAASRRVASDAITRETGINLLYPDYKKGLQAVLEAEGK